MRSGRLWHGVALVLSFAPCGTAAAQQRFTLEQVLSAPFASELVAAPTNGRIAWMENVLGTRNIWLADPPDYRGRQLTRFTGDDGKYLVQLAFAPDGRSVAFVHGGAHSGTRLPDPPNPTLDPAGGHEEVWIVSTEGGDPVKVDDGLWPTISPSGKFVAYIKRDQIWGASLSRTANGGISVGAPRLLVRDRGAVAPAGNATSMRWSPNGDLLAYVSLRDQHSFIGVFDAAANTLLYLDPSTDRDQEPVWSPDGARIAFVRVVSEPAERTSGAQREAQPWSIRIADAKTGRGREVWRASPGMGSAFWGFMNAERQLFWGAGDRIAFPWEKTGWVHLYSVAAAGGPPIDLTPGEHEVEHVVLAPNGRELVYSSNQGDIDRRHLWRVPIGAAAPQPVTTGTGIEYWPVITSDGAALAFQSTGAKVPPQVELVRFSDLRVRRVLAPGLAPPGFPASSLVEPRQVIFPSAGGLQIHGQLFLPPDYRADRRYPAVVYFHGGSRAQMVLGYHYHRFDYYQKHYAFNQYLASRGYIVMSVNYRSGTGYGMLFREAENYGATGASEVQDVIAAGQYLRSRQDVDARRIGLWGGSYGGYLTAMGLARASDLFAAGFDLHGVESWDMRVSFSPFSSLTAEERERVRVIARQSSPIGNVDTWKSPVLFVHGDDDRNVTFNQTVAVASMLRKRGVDVEELVIPNEIHSFLLHASWLRAFEAGADFFDRRLKNLSTAARMGAAQ